MQNFSLRQWRAREKALKDEVEITADGQLYRMRGATPVANAALREFARSCVGQEGDMRDGRRQNHQPEARAKGDRGVRGQRLAQAINDGFGGKLGKGSDSA